MCQFELLGLNGEYLRFRIIGYEHPDENIEPSEDNPIADFDEERFLIAECHFALGGVAWTAAGAILTTGDLAKLQDFVEQSGSSGTESPGCYFTERDIEFSYDRVARTIVVYVSYRFKPPNNGSCGPIEIAFPVTAEILGAVSENLAKCIRQFPGRPIPM
jgi:hypothetical protein